MSDSQPQPYRVLARKYRPSSFAELIGQDAMVQTLGNAIARERLAHAFLLTGVAAWARPQPPASSPRRSTASARRGRAARRSSRAACASHAGRSPRGGTSMWWKWTPPRTPGRSEEHTSELQSLMRISYAVFCLKKKKTTTNHKYSIYYSPVITYVKTHTTTQ